METSNRIGKSPKMNYFMPTDNDLRFVILILTAMLIFGLLAICIHVFFSSYNYMFNSAFLYALSFHFRVTRVHFYVSVKLLVTRVHECHRVLYSSLIFTFMCITLHGNNFLVVISDIFKILLLYGHLKIFLLFGYLNSYRYLTCPSFSFSPVINMLVISLAFKLSLLYSLNTCCIFYRHFLRVNTFCIYYV